MRLATALAPLLVAAVFATPALAAGQMQMIGHGEVMAAPDSAFVTSGVTTQGTTAKDALDANTAAMSALIGVLKTAGIDEKDIQTSGFTVNPNYVYPENGSQEAPKITGYIVANTVTVHVRDLKLLGGLLDQAVTVGANTINGISFAVEDTTKLYAEARKSAFADARAKADLYAQAADVELGAIANINENTGYTQPPQPYMAKAVGVADMAPVPVQAGQLTFTVDVNVTWDLEPGR